MLLHAALVGDSTRFTRQDGVEETWRVMQPLLDAPPPGACRTRPGSWGPEAADDAASPVTGAGTGPGSSRDRRADDQRRDAPQSAAAPSPFPPIADYAFLSDCHTGRARRARRRDRLALRPRASTAPSVFGSLLDRQAGFFRFGPFGINHPTARAYVPGTNVLETTWKTPSGWVVVRDALTIGPRDHEDTVTPHTRPPADDDADHMLVRTVECLDGRVEIELVCEPAFDYGREPATWTLVDDDRHAADATGAGQTVRLRLRSRARHRGRAACAARHVLEAGERAYCALSWAEGLAAPQTSTRPPRGSTRRRASGAGGSAARGSPITACATRSSARRSTIKGLTYMPTGATVAALTTSLPETPGGERNWDYRYTWIRDTTFTLQALHWLNLDWEADEFMQFVADVEPTEDGSLQIMYGIDGRRDLTETTRDDLTGYAGARPVRIGNGAFDQRQNDVFGAVLDSILLHTRHSERLPRRLWPIVETQAECATQVWREPDQGIWEARGKPQHYVSSKLMCWVALDRAAQARRDPRRSRAGSESGARPPRRSAPTSSSTASERRRASPALRDRLARRVDAARGDLRLPARRRRAPARDRCWRSPTS